VAAESIFHGKQGTVVAELMVKQYAKIRALMLALVMGLGTMACAHKTGNSSAPHPERFWPNPPETRRIEFLNAIYGPGDLNINPGFFTKVVRSIAGIPETPIVTPHGVTVDAKGRLYVVDTDLKRVHVFDVKDNSHKVFPEDGTLLSSPVDIAVDDRSGLIFVTDSKQGLVKKFGESGKQLEGSFGSNLFKRPTGIAINGVTSELLVVDTLQSRVFRFDLSTLEPKGSFGGPGNTNGRFHYPTHIFVASDGRILVSDSLNFRVQVFTPKGLFLNIIGGMGRTPGSFSRPKGVAADSDGNIYVVDALFDNIQIFDPRGQLLLAFGEHGNGVGSFWLPTKIYIDPDDVIYVSDSSNHRIQIFKYLKEDVANDETK
jgi:DNA-binding beta-propeller fold protein YncE